MLCKCIWADHSQVDQLTRQTYWTVGFGLCSGVNWKPEYFRVYWSCNIPDPKGLWCTTYWAIVGGTLCIAVVTWVGVWYWYMLLWGLNRAVKRVVDVSEVKVNDMGHWWRQHQWWTRRNMNTSLPSDLSVGNVLTMCARSHSYQL